eukprot:TRINITY_DN4703_c0_g1_i2.p1 TRINITY_DN4703_c0_g1~~TRINITY_DN4703_c0_g1_i2.p1  ORF type:complete len:104 (-),score=5.14 TRINITY_DN4703_c0_g1_i2:34-345(-)
MISCLKLPYYVPKTSTNLNLLHRSYVSASSIITERARNPFEVIQSTVFTPHTSCFPSRQFMMNLSLLSFRCRRFKPSFVAACSILVALQCISRQIAVDELWVS